MYSYFSLSVGIVNGIVVLIPSDSLLSVHCNFTHFCTLILYFPETLLSSFVSSNSFLLSLEFSTYMIMSSANKKFYFFLSNLVSFIPFSCLIRLLVLSWTEVARVGILALYWILEEKFSKVEASRGLEASTFTLLESCTKTLCKKASLA